MASMTSQPVNLPTYIGRERARLRNTEEAFRQALIHAAGQDIGHLGVNDDPAPLFEVKKAKTGERRPKHPEKSPPVARVNAARPNDPHATMAAVPTKAAQAGLPTSWGVKIPKEMLIPRDGLASEIHPY